MSGSTAHGSVTETSMAHARGPRPTPRRVLDELGAVMMALPWLATAPLLRRWHLHWGATAAECASSMPGDELVSACQFVCTRAITIDAPPDAVWPWLAQVGFGKAGFYSLDLLDNTGRSSATQILREHQTPTVGDWVPMFTQVNDTTAFRVAEIDPPTALLWRKPDSTWAWRLTDLDGRTRLVTRLRARYDWSRPAAALLTVILMEFADFPMMREMLRGIRRRAESGGKPTR